MVEDTFRGARVPAIGHAQADRACDMPSATGPRTAGDVTKRSASAWLQQRIRKLARLLGGRLRLEGTGGNLRIVMDPSLPSTVSAAKLSASREFTQPGPPVIQAADLARVRNDLTTILDQHPAARALWPSLALIERGLRKHGDASFARMRVAVLRDAAKVLGRLVDDWCEPGLLALYEHVVVVLQTLHGEDPPYVAACAERRFEAQVLDGSMTDFMTVDRLWDQRLAQDG